MYTVYGVCEKCGRIVSKKETTMTGSDTMDGESYASVDSKVCGCKKRKVKVDVGRGH